MNAEIKKLWIEDLRAHPDMQGRGKLMINGKSCCLGRLCLLAVDAGIIPPPVVISTGVAYFSATAAN